MFSNNIVCKIQISKEVTHFKITRQGYDKEVHCHLDYFNLVLERVMEIMEEAKPMELNRNLILDFSDNKTIFGNNT